MSKKKDTQKFKKETMVVPLLKRTSQRLWPQNMEMMERSSLRRVKKTPTTITRKVIKFTLLNTENQAIIIINKVKDNRTRDSIKQKLLVNKQVLKKQVLRFRLEQVTPNKSKFNPQQKQIKHIRLTKITVPNNIIRDKIIHKHLNIRLVIIWTRLIIIQEQVALINKIELLLMEELKEVILLLCMTRPELLPKMYTRAIWYLKQKVQRDWLELMN